jgi:hypothetical protein
MISDTVRDVIKGQPDMEIVGDLRGPMKILQEVGRTKADAVVFGQSSTHGLGLCSQLLAVYPDLTICGIASDMTAAFLQQLCSRRRDIVDTGGENIVETLRVAVRHPCSEEEG